MHRLKAAHINWVRVRTARTARPTGSAPHDEADEGSGRSGMEETAQSRSAQQKYELFSKLDVPVEDVETVEGEGEAAGPGGDTWRCLLR